MTKKDYIVIARAFMKSKMVKETIEKNQIKRTAAFDALRLAANNLAGELKSDNPNFDQDKFLTACGF